ncbi:uncharacterized protein N0V89_004523 [Didymosphaeria variabile]|uniref:Acid protease n=1 Tax=Didymosphaeria variabile TaxID=1932322 RepID=A0A9W8XQE9_9PLEO|nr:uncharacterized protein N0V89_004523 [Didymosphaeria variabile]KAJ4356489.1 hypothetical protein N0V89_004523 [Didymosphaeria variabile]
MFQLILQAFLCSVVVARTFADDLSTYSTKVYLPYASKFSPNKTPTINGTIEGKSFVFPVDTSSTGLLIGAPQLPTISNTTGTPISQYLGKTLYTGRFVRLNITFSGKNNSARSEVLVHIVDKSTSCPKYNVAKNTGRCEDAKAKVNDVSKVLTLGIGFGHNLPNSGLPYAIPSHNPFLNIQEINGNKTNDKDFRNGYTLSTKGIYLGLTSNNTAKYNWVKLDKGTTGDFRDWAKVRTQFKIDEQGSYNGSALIDTTTGYMYVQASPAGSVPNTTVADTIHKPLDKNKKLTVVKPGTHLDFGFPTGREQEGVAGFDFKVGDKKKGVPKWVFPTRVGPGPHVVMGRNFLEGFSVAFDAAGGRYGFKCLECGKAESGKAKGKKATSKKETSKKETSKKETSKKKLDGKGAGA